MKKIYTLFTFLAPFAICTAQSQLPVKNLNLVAVEATSEKSALSSLVILDTLKPASFTMACFTSDPTPLVYYTLGAAGYLAGNNSYGETECAQSYPFTGSGTISTVLVRYGKKAGVSGTTSAKIYAVDATTKLPTTVMGTSGIITISNIPATGYTSYTFAAPVTVTAEFAVAAILPIPAAGDSVAVVSTKQGCATNNLSSLNIPQFGGWNTIADLITSDSIPDTSIDLTIRPVVNTVGGIGEYPSSNGLTLKGTYPNPANDFANIQYHISTPSVVSVEVFDLAGRVLQQSSEQLSSGNHQVKLSLKDIAPGNYYYTIKTEAAELTSKFVVIQ